MSVLQDLFTGVSSGSVYGAIGVGYVVIHRITGMVNFAQGDIAVAGAFGAVAVSSQLPPGAAVGAGALTGGAIGALLYALAIHPVRRHGLLVQTIVTLGVALVLRSLAQLIYGTGPYTFRPFTDAGPIEVAGAVLQSQAVAVALLALLLYAALSAFFERTMTGRAMSACAVNRYAASLLGINPALMALAAFTVAGAAVGLVAAAQTPLTFVSSGAGLALSLKGFIAAVLGGFERVGLALAGGVLVGVFESVAASSLSAAYQDVIVLGALLALLLLRPSGLSRTTVAERV